jgi:hypothetical protein
MAPGSGLRAAPRRLTNSLANDLTNADTPANSLCHYKWLPTPSLIRFARTADYGSGTAGQGPRDASQTGVRIHPALRTHLPSAPAVGLPRLRRRGPSVGRARPTGHPLHQTDPTGTRGSAAFNVARAPSPSDGPAGFLPPTRLCKPHKVLPVGLSGQRSTLAARVQRLCRNGRTSAAHPVRRPPVRP